MTMAAQKDTKQHRLLLKCCKTVLEATVVLLVLTLLVPFDACGRIFGFLEEYRTSLITTVADYLQ